MDVLFQYGLQGIVAFGAIGALSYLKKDISSEVKLALLAIVAFAIGYIPASLGNDLFNHIKEAVAVAFGVHAAYTMLKMRKK